MTDLSASGQLTHGFLFADLRGYTAFAEARGDSAAAELLDRYRALVRGVISTTDGVEIKTEGDSFYLVFPSASRAVSAGLAIVAAAAESGGTARPPTCKDEGRRWSGGDDRHWSGWPDVDVRLAARLLQSADGWPCLRRVVGDGG